MTQLWKSLWIAWIGIYHPLYRLASIVNWQASPVVGSGYGCVTDLSLLFQEGRCRCLPPMIPRSSSCEAAGRSIPIPSGWATNSSPGMTSSTRAIFARCVTRCCGGCLSMNVGCLTAPVSTVTPARPGTTSPGPTGPAAWPDSYPSAPVRVKRASWSPRSFCSLSRCDGSTPVWGRRRWRGWSTSISAYRCTAAASSGRCGAQKN